MDPNIGKDCILTIIFYHPITNEILQERQLILNTDVTTYYINAFTHDHANLEKILPERLSKFSLMIEFNKNDKLVNKKI
jgi:hypothetical protein